MSITIGIPSYNEGKNLINLLNQIKDEYRKYKTTIKEIIIVDDSDNYTKTLIEKHLKTTVYPYPIIYIHNKERKGVANAWNKIFREARGEIIILLDADIKLGEKTIKTIAQELYQNNRLGIIGCRTEPLIDKSIAAKATYVVAQWLHLVRKKHPRSQFTIMGRTLGIKTKIAKKIMIPTNLISPDLYLQCIVSKQGYQIEYLDKVKIYFTPPTTIRDFASQILRGYLGHKQLDILIKKSIHDRLELIQQTRLFIEQLLNSRNLNLIISTITSYLATLIYIPIIWRGAATHLWETAKTTKNIIINK